MNQPEASRLASGTGVVVFEDRRLERLVGVVTDLADGRDRVIGVRLERNGIVTSSDADYGTVYMPSDRARERWDTVEEITSRVRD